MTTPNTLAGRTEADPSLLRTDIQGGDLFFQERGQVAGAISGVALQNALLGGDEAGGILRSYATRQAWLAAIAGGATWTVGSVVWAGSGAVMLTDDDAEVIEGAPGWVDVPTLTYGMTPSAQGIIPQIHLAKAARATAPKVVIAGDSIATSRPTITHGEVDSLWGEIQRAFEAMNPNAPLTFVNRAIGGATFTHFNDDRLGDTGLTLPDWADADTAWLSHIETEAPDVLIINFGMNDRENFVTPQFRSAMATIVNWAKVPDIIFVTPMVPSRLSDDTTISSETSRDGRNFVAHYLRTYAETNGYGLLDVNRAYCRIAEGYDPRVTSFDALSPVSGNLPLSISECQNDFGMEITMSPTSGFWSNPLVVSLSPEMPNSESLLRIGADAGNLWVEVQTIDDVPGRVRYTTAVAAPNDGTEVVLEIWVQDGMLDVRLDDEIVHLSQIFRHGGTFAPTLSRPGGAPFSATVQGYRGSYVQGRPMLTDREAWGDPDGNNGTLGGNGKNHPTSVMASLVYRSTLDRQDLRLPVMGQRGNPWGATGEVSSYLPAPSGGSSWLDMSALDDTGRSGFAFSATVDQITAHILDQVMLRIFTPTTDGQTSLQVNFRNGSTDGIELVQADAADGSGRRFLYVQP